MPPCVYQIYFTQESAMPIRQYKLTPISVWQQSLNWQLMMVSANDLLGKAIDIHVGEMIVYSVPYKLPTNVKDWRNKDKFE